VLLLPDPVDSFWVTSAPSFEGKPFKSVTQGAADLAQIPRLERLLAGAGRIASAAKPILEVNSRHQLIVALAELSPDARAFKEDAVHLLFDEARVIDGERPADARAFSDRLARVLERGLGTG
jgi:molecular chaperone HtpG